MQRLIEKIRVLDEDLANEIEYNWANNHFSLWYLDDTLFIPELDKVILADGLCTGDQIYINIDRWSKEVRWPGGWEPSDGGDMPGPAELIDVYEPWDKLDEDKLARILVHEYTHFRIRFQHPDFANNWGARGECQEGPAGYAELDFLCKKWDRVFCTEPDCNTNPTLEWDATDQAEFEDVLKRWRGYFYKCLAESSNPPHNTVEFWENVFSETPPEHPCEERILGA